MYFGKHKGKTIRWIIQNDPLYLKWVEENVSNMTLHTEVIDCMFRSGIPIAKRAPLKIPKTKRFHSPKIERW